MASGAQNRPALSNYWKKFSRRFGQTRAYWYVPKGLAATPQAIRERLEVLQEFSGGDDWRNVQAAYIAALKAAQVSEAETDWSGGGAPLARMLKQVFNVLGLAWVNDTDRIEITKAGREFLESDDSASKLSSQVWRYQFWNPAVRSVEHQAIRVHPVPFLAELLRSLGEARISANEYILFVAQAESNDSIDDVAQQIELFRELSPEQQAELCEQCDKYMLGGSRRSSIFNTIKLNRSYAFGMWTLSSLIDRDEHGGLILAKGKLRDYRSALASFQKERAYIDFKNQKDWIAYIGDPDAMPTRETALAYYISTGDVEGAVEVRKTQNVSKAEIREFKDMLLSERQVEDYLEKNLDFIGKEIGAHLVLIGRQYSTTVGPIDLLAKDDKSGKYVVIELKKGRGADKVYGQLSRYMGWVRQNLAQGEEVIGVVVAKSIDAKLKAARDAHNTAVHLVEFSLKIGSRKV